MALVDHASQEENGDSENYEEDYSDPKVSILCNSFLLKSDLVFVCNFSSKNCYIWAHIGCGRRHFVFIVPAGDAITSVIRVGLVVVGNSYTVGLSISSAIRFTSAASDTTASSCNLINEKASQD